MSEIEKIKQRIEKRKKRVDLNREVKELDKPNKTNNIYKFFMGVMSIYALFMSFAIYAKKDATATYLNSVFNTNINFTNFNKALANLMNFKIVEDNNDNELTDMIVSSNANYVSLGEDYYTSEGNLVVALDSGVITYVNGKDENYTIIVEYDSGFRATYNNVNEVNVFVNDRVYADDILGSFLDKVEIIFIKDAKKITYEEVVSII